MMRRSRSASRDRGSADTGEANSPQQDIEGEANAPEQDTSEPRPASSRSRRKGRGLPLTHKDPEEASPEADKTEVHLDEDDGSQGHEEASHDQATVDSKKSSNFQDDDDGEGSQEKSPEQLRTPRPKKKEHTTGLQAKLPNGNIVASVTFIVNGKPYKRSGPRPKHVLLTGGSSPSETELSARKKTPDVPDGNQSYCHVCKDFGDIVCCDGCPHVYHLTCIPEDNPSRQALENDEDPWFCPDCMAAGNTTKRGRTVRRRCCECQQSGGDVPMEPCEGCGAYMHHPSCRGGEDDDNDLGMAAAPLCSNCQAEEVVTKEEDELEQSSLGTEDDSQASHDRRRHMDDDFSRADDEDDHQLGSKRKRSGRGLDKSAKKKRGRPPLSTEEKEARAKERAERKAAKKRKKKKKRAKSMDQDYMDLPMSPIHEEEAPSPRYSYETPTGLVKATPAFFFFLSDNRFKIERVLARKHRVFNRLPKGMERNELIAREAAHWWVKLRPSDHRRYLNMSMRDFEERVVEWKQDNSLREMELLPAAEEAVEDMSPARAERPKEPTPEEDMLTYQTHQRLYLDTTVGSKPFTPEPGKSNNRVLLELLQDMRFHPLPMLNAKRPQEENELMDYSKMAIPFFEVHGGVATSLGDECLGCSRGWNHFCPVLKRRFPAIEHRAKLQPPLSSLMATRVGLGLRPKQPTEGPDKSTAEESWRRAPPFSVKETAESTAEKLLPPIPCNTLAHPSSRADDITLFVEEAVAMKVPEPPRPSPPGSSLKRSTLSRGALPIGRRKKFLHNVTAFEGGEHGQAEILNKCGRCRTVTQSDNGCVQCRRAQLVINTSKRQPAAIQSGHGRKGEGKSSQGLLKVQTTMLGRLSAKDTNFDQLSEGDLLIGQAITRTRWSPNAVLPPKKISAPRERPYSESDSDSDEGSGRNDSDAVPEEDDVDVTMEDVTLEKDHVPPEEDLTSPMAVDDEQSEKASLKETSSHESDGAVDDTSVGRATRRQRSARRVATSSTPVEHDRQQAAREHRQEADALNKRCISVASCGILLAMMRRDPLLLFAEPVPSTVEAYTKIVSDPIDFGTIRTKVLNDEYTTLGSFISDARRLCTNALAYNPAGTIYSKTARELHDVLEIMQKRASDWMAAIKTAHSSSFAWRGPASSPSSLLFDQDGKESEDDPFKELRKTWPEAVDILESGDWLRNQIASDFMRTKENETAYYGSLAIRRAAAAAEASLAAYPDTGGTHGPVTTRSHVDDEALRTAVNNRVANLTKPVELKDIPTWREESALKILRRVQTRRVESRISSDNGCARCDGVRIEQEAKLAMRAETVRWGRNKRKGAANTVARVASTRLSLSTGLGSKKTRELMEEKKAKAKNDQEIEESIGDAAVSVRGSDIHGWGLFADQSFKPGDVVAEYVGEYVTHAEADAREKMYQEQRIQDYQFRADELVIDATLKGGLGRYINHNCNPNCIAKIVEGKPPNRHLKRVIITAQRNIKARDEITYDYQFPLELDLDARIPCNCGSTQCRGFMNWDLPEKGSKNRVVRPQKRGGNMRDRIRRLGRPRKRDEN